MASILTSFFIITLVNILAYIWAYKKQSDHLTDISYSLCFIAVTAWFLFDFGVLSPGRLVLSMMVILWGLRLGGFLFYRITKMGKDKRFDAFRSSSSGFLKFWLLQSLSITIIILPVLFGLLAQSIEVCIPALLLWGAGMVIESVADWQKFIFKSNNPPNAFISHGMYKYIRHPNYTGEILIWVSVFWYVSPILTGWQWVSVISPGWIIILLTAISGIPLIEKENKKKFKEDPEYASYIARTRRLVPGLY
jgi:steroid 5-alpha reductase family enzyme